jgi:serine/threonine protein kinase
MLPVADPDAPHGFLGRPFASSTTPTRVYTPHALLGAGSQALVFAARSDNGAPVALKVFRPSFFRTHGTQAAVIAQKEWTALRYAPPSPYVVRLLDFGQLASELTPRTLPLPWLALERIEGKNLRDLVTETRQRTGFGLDPWRALRILGFAAEGLRVLHEAGILHRDIKPSNLLVSGAPPEENTRIADLGLSRAAHARGLAPTFGVGPKLGAPEYSAPEAHDPARVGPAADVFSFAACAYFTLAGEPMFAGSPHVIAALMNLEAAPPLASRAGVHPAFAPALAGLSHVLARGTRRDPAARFPTVRAFWVELAGELAHALGSSPTPAPAPRATGVFQLNDEDGE